MIIILLIFLMTPPLSQEKDSPRALSPTPVCIRQVVALVLTQGPDVIYHYVHREPTPLWVPLVVAGLAVLGTLAGVLVTQRWSYRREAIAWTRERQREQERWAREDEARTFEHRREACAEFYVAVKALARKAYEHGFGLIDDEDRPGESGDSDPQCGG